MYVCRSFALRLERDLGLAHFNVIVGSIGGMTWLTALHCGFCATWDQYIPTVFSLPSLMHLHIRVKDRHLHDSDAMRVHFAMLSSKLTSLGFSGGTQSMVRLFLIHGCVVTCQPHQGADVSVASIPDVYVAGCK